MRVRSYNEILNSGEDVIFIDIRTEGEFNDGTIPGAVNIPLFSNEQRAVIGTIYKQVNPKAATEKAILYISERLPKIFEKISELDKQRKTLVFFCARGGMRSRSIVGLLSGLNYNCEKLDFGYKGYRAFINTNLPKELEKVKFITLYGNTGTGKTNILKELKEMGQDVLDLEFCANHRGSILGQIGLDKQNSQKQFESLIYDMLIKRKSDVIFTEGESKRIGHIVMQDFIFDKIVGDTKILIHSPIDYRIGVIKKEYINEHFDKQEIIKGLTKLNRYIGKRRSEELIEQTTKENYDIVIEELMLNYYDLNYKCNEETFEKTIMSCNSKETAKELMQFSENIKEVK